jgi:orotate phosphoribosyltransferase
MNSDIEDVLQSKGYITKGGHFRLASNKHSDAYIQVRLALMDGAILKKFIQTAKDKIKDLDVSMIGGFTVGGIIFAQALADDLKIPIVYGRKLNVDFEWIKLEGIRNKKNLLLIDDIATTTTQINSAIRSLEATKLASISAILVAVDRQPSDPDFNFRGKAIKFDSCLKMDLDLHNPSDCPHCQAGVPLTDLSNPEKNVVSVLVSQPLVRIPIILKAYKEVYEKQHEKELLAIIERWVQWFSRFSGDDFPNSRIMEDSQYEILINELATAVRNKFIQKQVLSKIVDQLMRLSFIRVESRWLGCSLLIGDSERIMKRLHFPSLAERENLASADISELVPVFDAFLETDYALVLNSEGKIDGFRRLEEIERKTGSTLLTGIRLLRKLTKDNTKTIAFVLRRGRSAISIYWDGELQAIWELSERSGMWQFSQPIARINEIKNKVDQMGTISIEKFAQHLDFIVEVCREMVAKAHGALFLIGDTANLPHSSPKVEINPTSLEELSIDEVGEMAKLDGATMINTHGQLVRFSVILNPAEEAESVKEEHSIHGGARYNVVRRASKACPNCVAIYVSQNGAIEAYINGESWSITEATPGLSDK